MGWVKQKTISRYCPFKSLVRSADPDPYQNTSLNADPFLENPGTTFQAVLCWDQKVSMSFLKNSVKLIYFFLFSKDGRICPFTINIIKSAADI